MDISGESSSERASDPAQNQVLVNGTECLQVSLSFPVLDYINEIRYKHGIRLEEYSHYRKYCSRKLHNLRKQLKPNPGKPNKYVHEEFPPSLNDNRYLEILAVRCERCWTFAMDLKSKMQTSSSNNNRGRHYYMRKFGKAYRLSLLLEDYCKKFGDSNTSNNAKVYRNFMEGVFRYEQERFEEAHSCLSSYMAVMEQKSRSITGYQSTDGYNSQISQLKSMIKMCNFHMKVIGKTIATPSASKMEDSNAELIQVKKTSEDSFVVHCRGLVIPLESQLLPQKILDALNSVDKLVVTDDLFLSLRDSPNILQELRDHVESKFSKQELLNNYDEVTSAFNECTEDVYTELMSNMENQGHLRKLEVSLVFLRSLLGVEKHVLLETLTLQDLLRNKEGQGPLPNCDEGIRYANILKQQLASLMEDQAFGKNFLVPNEVVRTVNSLLLSVHSFRKGDLKEGLALVHWSNTRSTLDIALPDKHKNRLLWRCLVSFTNLQSLCSLVSDRLYQRLFAIFARTKFAPQSATEESVLDIFNIDKQMLICRPFLFDLAFIYYEAPELETGTRFKGNSVFHTFFRSAEYSQFSLELTDSLLD